jgi:hypothetical protein
MLSLTIASTRPWISSCTPGPKSCTYLTFARASRATSAQLLLAVWAVVRPSRSVSVVMSSVPLAVTMTPWE